MREQLLYVCVCNIAKPVAILCKCSYEHFSISASINFI